MAYLFWQQADNEEENKIEGSPDSEEEEDRPWCCCILFLDIQESHIIE